MLDGNWDERRRSLDLQSVKQKMCLNFDEYSVTVKDDPMELETETKNKNWMYAINLRHTNWKCQKGKHIKSRTKLI